MQDLKLEVVVVPVSDMDRAKRFYDGLGWRVDADLIRGDGSRVVQLTPPASESPSIFGKAVTRAGPRSVRGRG